MRPLTSITAAATLGTKPETSALGDRSQKTLLIATAAACDLTPPIGQKSNSARLCHRFATVAGERSQPSMGGIAADAGMPAGNDVETRYAGSSEVARRSPGCINDGSIDTVDGTARTCVGAG